MRKICSIAIAAFLIFLTSSCTKEDLVQKVTNQDMGRVVFNVNTGRNNMVSTKTAEEDEQAIRRVGVFIVKQNGELADGIKRFYETKDLTEHKLPVSIPFKIMETGNIKAYLIANCGDKNIYDAIKTEEELLELVADTKTEDTASKGIPMASDAISLNFTGGIATADANMKRVMSALYTKVIKGNGALVSPKDFTFKVHGISNKKGYCFKDQVNDTESDQLWKSTSEVLNKEIPLGYFYQSNAFQIEVTSNTTGETQTIEIPAEEANMRNKKYLLKILPNPDSNGSFTVTVEKWSTKERDVLFRFLLTDFEPGSDFAEKGIKWDKTTRTLDITNATEASVLKFNAKGATALKTSVIPLYNKSASSIGGEKSLADILEVSPLTDENFAIKVNIPVQTVKVPLDILVSIQNFGEENNSKTITIKSRPDYAGTGIQPVMMKTTDNNLVFWAPINVGATRMPESVPATDNTDITESCGKLFQWGRKSGVAATNNPATIDAEKFEGKTESLGFPKGEAALAEMSKWDGKFIVPSSSPNTQHNWLLFDASGTDNPDGAGMENGAWYQKLWNSGTEEAPVKTEYDPCPEGWRVPTLTEWKAISAQNTITKKWGSQSIYIASAESGRKLLLPAAGYRNYSAASYFQGSSGYFWSSSVPSGSANVRSVGFNSAMLFTLTNYRTNGLSVRCVQDD